MKIVHSISGLSRVSFTTIDQINPVTNSPTGVKLDHWEDIPNSTAKGLEELQVRIEALENILKNTLTEEKLVELMETAERITLKHDKPPKEEPPPGKPLSRIKKKRIPKKKAEVAHE